MVGTTTVAGSALQRSAALSGPLASGLAGVVALSVLGPRRLVPLVTSEGLGTLMVVTGAVLARGRAGRRDA